MLAPDGVIDFVAGSAITAPERDGTAGDAGIRSLSCPASSCEGQPDILVAAAG
jgi:hypothetical protein